MTTANPDGAAAMTKIAGLSGDMDESAAAEELLRRFLPDDKDAKQPSDKAKDEDKTETDPKATPEDDASAEKPEDKSDDEDEGDEDEEAEAETVIKVKIGDEEHEVPASKLARLYGQEAALTKKSMEVAEQRKQAEAQLSTNAAATNALLQRAQARFEPYSKLDFNLLAAQVGREGGVTAEEYQSLRQSAQAAYEDVQFLSTHLDGFNKALQERVQGETRQKAVECVKVLSGPEDKGGIPGWNEKLYDDIRSFAVSQGAPSDVINQVVEPWALRMLHSAMLHARGKEKGKIVTTKKNNTPKKIVKTTESPAASKRTGGDSEKLSKLKQRMVEYGSTDDVAEFLLARHNEARSSAD